MWSRQLFKVPRLVNRTSVHDRTRWVSLVTVSELCTSAILGCVPVKRECCLPVQKSLLPSPLGWSTSTFLPISAQIPPPLGGFAPWNCHDHTSLWLDSTPSIASAWRLGIFLIFPQRTTLFEGTDCSCAAPCGTHRARTASDTQQVLQKIFLEWMGHQATPFTVKERKIQKGM